MPVAPPPAEDELMTLAAIDDVGDDVLRSMRRSTSASGDILGRLLLGLRPAGLWLLLQPAPLLLDMARPRPMDMLAARLP